jgi:hypothetical protein
VHTLCAWIVSRGNDLLGILAHERILVIPLFEGARDGHVPVFDVKSTLEAHIPIVVYLIDVGEIWVAVLLLVIRSGRKLCEASAIRN